MLDVVRHPKMFATDHLGPTKAATLDRWTVDLADGKVRESRVDDRGQEFPRVDERLVGKRHRYGYAPAVGDGTRATTCSQARPDRRRQPGPSFGTERVRRVRVRAASPDAAEDEGVLMGYVYDREADRSGLAILDAQTLEESQRQAAPSGARGIPRQPGADACFAMDDVEASEIVGPVDRVVVVGAGNRGPGRRVSAVAWAGIAYVVLEARDRIGGRLHTIHLAGTPVDLGGSWIHHPIGNPLSAFCDTMTGVARDRGRPHPFAVGGTTAPTGIAASTHNRDHAARLGCL